MSDGIVVDIWRVIRDKDTYKWRRVREGDDLPEVTEAVNSYGKVQWRVQVKPHGLGSRNFWRGDWHDYHEVIVEGTKEADVKLVTLLNIENITVIDGGFTEEDLAGAIFAVAQSEEVS